VGRLKRRCELEVYVERDPVTAASLRPLIPDRQLVVGDCTRVIVPENVPDEAVLYADPPYLMSVRRSKKKYYRFELSTDAEHERLLAWLLRFRCRVLISGYWIRKSGVSSPSASPPGPAGQSSICGATFPRRSSVMTPALWARDTANASASNEKLRGGHGGFSRCRMANALLCCQL
jgi:hypothetical protein